MRIVGDFILLGDKRADGQDWGECAWMVMKDNMWDASPWRITRLTRMPYPYWWATRFSHV